MTSPPATVLDERDWLNAIVIAARRRWASREYRDQHGYDKNAPISFYHEFMAACAEKAVANAMGLPWTGGVDSFKLADVGDDVQVRCAFDRDHRLIFRPGDPLEHRYVLARCVNDYTFQVFPPIYGVEIAQWGVEADPVYRPGALWVDVPSLLARAALAQQAQAVGG